MGLQTRPLSFTGSHPSTPSIHSAIILPGIHMELRTEEAEKRQVTSDMNINVKVALFPPRLCCTHHKLACGQLLTGLSGHWRPPRPPAHCCHPRVLGPGFWHQAQSWQPPTPFFLAPPELKPPLGARDGVFLLSLSMSHLPMPSTNITAQ